MKHPHADLIKQWLDNINLDIEQQMETDEFYDVNILRAIHDTNNIKVFRVKPDEYEFLREAIKNGKRIEMLMMDDKWEFIDNPQFNLPVGNYRIYDPYRELEEALAAGKRVMWLDEYDNWVDAKRILTYYIPIRYKIAEPDITDSGLYYSSVTDNAIRVKFTKSGIDGKITAEVIE